jgi:hypothetical protein
MVLFEKVIVTHLVKKLPVFYRTQRLIAVFTKPATGLCPEPHDRVNILTKYDFKVHFNIIFLSIALGLPSGSSL